ncbi:MAG: valine--tRNA ligase [Deltaproteobacteria bacterium]|nr:valine--tRNA ligase [Deltaproteobacteria bacterium]
MNKKELNKVYNPKTIEEKWARFWLDENIFHANTESKKPAFAMVIPPPNITGSLHIGHALNNSIQDILARYKRMKGFKVLWLPGTDHAGIATQNVVEKQIALEGTDRHKIGREKFIERVWKWKEESGGQIINQLKRLGSSCDWARLRFTMDEGLSKAVREVFVRLYNEGLIYRGDYIINWCPRCHTALSDLEVETEETDGSLYYINYPIADVGTDLKSIPSFLTVATTRPETMLGDTAVAVHPDDKRYKSFIGKTLILPLIEREIPVIADSTVSTEFGTGAVKITPSHDFNDFEMARRHNLRYLKVMDLEGRMNENAGIYKGMDRFACRKKVVEDLKELGLLQKIEKYKINLGHCYRCKTVVEPTESKQWFVKIKPLAEPAIKAVEDGRTRFIPKNWENTYFDWMRNIRDWCISRQIWWGHRIPAWYCEQCDFITVSAEEPEVCEKCKSPEIQQETDVLDTWFSSALWPFSTLGWPNETKELKTFYPTSTLVTSFDIIFFWVARMLMLGLKFMDDVPFRDVYIHALIRDAEGQKMSKSKGNVIDPLVMMEKYGTDAFRFTLAAMAAQGRDIKLAEERIEGYRNFANKIWNLARFTLMSLGVKKSTPQLLNPSTPQLSLADKWILTRLNKTIEDVTKGIDEYSFDHAANAIYQFIWHELCDWYVELIKPDLRGDNGDEKKKDSQMVLLKVLQDSMKLLHPFMPFITEEIWETITSQESGVRSQGSGKSIQDTAFPEVDEKTIFKDDEIKMNRLMDVIKAIRNLRSEFNIPPSANIEVICHTEKDDEIELLKSEDAYVKTLTRSSAFGRERHAFHPSTLKLKDAATAVVGGIEIFIPLKGLIDISEETSRLGKEVEKVMKDISGLEKRLSNEAFVSKAPAEVVEKDKTRFTELTMKKAKIEENIQRLNGLR